MATIVLKATEACNCNCVYCEVVSRKKAKNMPLPLLEVMIKRINQYLEEEKNESINILWHGGEPLLLGKDYYFEAIHLFEKHCPNTKHRISHSMQSNLTLLNEDMIEVLKALNIKGIGTSFDPIPGVRGIGVERNTELYNSKFIEGTKLLEKHNIQWGFIFVVTKEALSKARELFHFANNFNKKQGINIHPVDIVGDEPKSYAITPVEFADFLGEMFELWYPNRDQVPSIEPFGSYLRIYEKNERMHGCNTSGNCANSHIYIGPSGETSHCGRFGDIDVLKYGNIQDFSLKEILYHKDRDVFKTRSVSLLANDCKDCPFWEICKGGCPAEAYYHTNSIHKKTYWCESKKVFLEKYFEPITGLKRTFNNYVYS